MIDRSSVLVVANRLPIDQVMMPNGETKWQRSPGGLVGALEPFMKGRNGAWVGWSGAAGPAPEPFVHDGLALHPVELSEEDVRSYYEGFSNASLWPLYHDVVVPPEFHRRWWDAYVRVNHRFADAAAKVAEQGALVWVHDYQLQLVPAMLRAQRPDLRIGFFLHIPFPPAELFMQLPWRARIVEGLLGADLIGFQRPGGAQNFLRLSRQLLGLRPQGNVVDVEGRQVRAQAFPISIDVGAIDRHASDPATADRSARIRADLGNPRRVILGVDRLDYTKGIGIRLLAFDELLREGRVNAPDTVMVQVATPSRERVEQYRVMRDEIERQVGRINGDYGSVGIPAVNYIHRHLPHDELVALYCAADVMAVTPLRDGMNLVAKEYVASRRDLGGALVLSEFAGAADELRQAFLVNPHDADRVKEAFMQALEVDPAAGARRIRAMRRHLQRYDLDHWAQSFLSALGVQHHELH